MALVSGGTYYLLSMDDYTALSNDDDYRTVYESFLNHFTQINIAGVNYYYAPHGSIDPDGLIAAINADTTDDTGVHAVSLETAVYWSGYGFDFQ